MPRQTKIVATLGPAVASPERVRSLIEAGMDVARLNFSHGGHEVHRQFPRLDPDSFCRVGSHRGHHAGHPGAQVPHRRVSGRGDRSQDGREVTSSPIQAPVAPGRIPIGYGSLLSDVNPGDRVILADGLVSCEVVGSTDSALRARVIIGGSLSDHKGVAFPDTSLSVGNITTKDEVDLALGLSSASTSSPHLSSAAVPMSRQSPPCR